MKRNSKINIGNSLFNLSSRGINPLVVRITREIDTEIPIQPSELELLGGHLDEVIAYVVKKDKIDGE